MSNTIVLLIVIFCRTHGGAASAPPSPADKCTNFHGVKLIYVICQTSNQHYSGIKCMSKLVLGRGGYFQLHIQNIRTPIQTGIKRNHVYNNILGLSLTRSIARKPQSFGRFKRISPPELEASTNARLSEKDNWHAWPD